MWKGCIQDVVLGLENQLKLKVPEMRGAAPSEERTLHRRGRSGKTARGSRTGALVRAEPDPGAACRGGREVPTRGPMVSAEECDQEVEITSDRDRRCTATSSRLRLPRSGQKCKADGVAEGTQTGELNVVGVTSRAGGQARRCRRCRQGARHEGPRVSRWWQPAGWGSSHTNQPTIQAVVGEVTHSELTPGRKRRKRC